MEKMLVRDFNDLIVWKRSIELAKQVYVLTRSFPREELFGLTSQMRRSAVSISSNIAEGNGRRTTKDFVSFLYVARGSLSELKTQYLLAKELGYAGEDSGIPDLVLQVGRMLNALISSLSARRKAIGD